MLVFVGASLSSTIDTLQHAPGAPAEHRHIGFSDLTVELDHADDHQAPQPGDDDAGDHLPGSHHHHGDSGSSLPVTVSAGSILFAMPGDQHGSAPDNQTPGLRILGPDRPPKSLTLNA